MNFALPSVVILVLVLPGFAFRTGLGQREGSRINHSPFSEVFFRSLVNAFSLHLILLAIAYLVFGHSPRVDILLRIVATGSNPISTGSIRFFPFSKCQLVLPAIR